MAEIKYYAGIDLQGNNLLNVALHPSVSAPSSPVEGMAWYDTTNNELKIYNGTAWVNAGQDITIAPDSTGFLSIVNGELSIHNLAITSVTVDTTYADLASFVASEYTVGNEFQEGDMIVLTVATDQQQRSFIHNGGVSGGVNDFTRLQTDIDTSTIRNALSAGSGLAYDSANGIFSADVDDVTVQVGAGGLEVKDAGISTAKLTDDSVTKEKINADVAGNGLGQNADGSLEVKVDNSTVEIVSDTVQVKDGGITESKLASAVTAKLNTGYAETVGDGVATSFTITHNLGTLDVIPAMYRVDTGECVQCNVARTNTNTITVGAFPAPATNNLRVLVKAI